MTPIKHKQRFSGAGESTKKAKKNFVFSPPEADVS
jgi:hypothetical protein